MGDLLRTSKEHFLFLAGSNPSSHAEKDFEKKLSKNGFQKKKIIGLQFFIRPHILQ